MITFQKESFDHAYADAEELLRMHYDEIAIHKDMALEPFTDAYKSLEQEGLIWIYTAREGEELVGYAAFVVTHMLHYRSHVQAVQDVLYIHPRLRGRTVGFRFIRYIDEQLTAGGVSLIAHHVKVAHPALGAVLAKLGYVQTEAIYQRKISWQEPQ